MISNRSQTAVPQRSQLDACPVSSPNHWLRVFEEAPGPTRPSHPCISLPVASYPSDPIINSPVVPPVASVVPAMRYSGSLGFVAKLTGGRGGGPPPQ